MVPSKLNLEHQGLYVLEKFEDRVSKRWYELLDRKLSYWLWFIGKWREHNPPWSINCTGSALQGQFIDHFMAKITRDAIVKSILTYSTVQTSRFIEHEALMKTHPSCREQFLGSFDYEPSRLFARHGFYRESTIFTKGARWKPTLAHDVVLMLERCRPETFTTARPSRDVTTRGT